MGRFGMLQCAANFGNGYSTKNCTNCEVIDDEAHRINDCPTWSSINLLNTGDKIDYNLIHNADENVSSKVIERIISIWDLGNNNNCMKTVDTGVQT